MGQGQRFLGNRDPHHAWSFYRIARKEVNPPEVASQHCREHSSPVSVRSARRKHAGLQALYGRAYVRMSVASHVTASILRSKAMTVVWDAEAGQSRSCKAMPIPRCTTVALGMDRITTGPKLCTTHGYSLQARDNHN